MGQHASAGHGLRHLGPRDLVGGDIDQSRRGLDGRQAQEQLVKLGARQHRVTAPGCAGQTHFFELAVYLFEQSLVACNGFGVTRVAGYPADDLGAVFKQLIRHVGIDQAGQDHIFGLDDVEVVTQLTRELLALVTGLHLHLQPARVGAEALGGGVYGQRVPAALEPAAIA